MRFKAGQGRAVTILASEASHTVKLVAVAGDDDERAAAGMAGDEDVVAADRPSFTLQRRTDVGCVMRRRRVEGQDLEPGGEGLDLPAVASDALISAAPAKAPSRRSWRSPRIPLQD